MPSSRGSSPPGDQIHVSQSPALAGNFFTIAPPQYQLLLFLEKQKEPCFTKKRECFWLAETGIPGPASGEQFPLSMKFSKQEYWRGVAIPFSRGLPNPGIEPRSPTSQADSLLSELSGKTGSNSSSAPNKTLGQRHSFFGAHFPRQCFEVEVRHKLASNKGSGKFQ